YLAKFICSHTAIFNMPSCSQILLTRFCKFNSKTVLSVSRGRVWSRCATHWRVWLSIKLGCFQQPSECSQRAMDLSRRLKFKSPENPLQTEKIERELEVIHPL